MRKGLRWIPYVTFAAGIAGALGLGVTQAFANPLETCGSGDWCNVSSCGMFCDANNPPGTTIPYCTSNACCVCIIPS